MSCPVCGWYSCSCSRRDLEDWHDRHWAGGDVRSRWDVEDRIDELKREERYEESLRERREEERRAEEAAAERRRADEEAYQQRQEEYDYYQNQMYAEDLQTTPCDENGHARMEEVGTCWCGALCYDRAGDPIDETNNTPPPPEGEKE